MGTTFGSFDEFWAAMARLYDQTLKHEELIAQNTAQIVQNAAHISQVSQ